jgi:hypothetical protein
LPAADVQRHETVQTIVVGMALLPLMTGILGVIFQRVLKTSTR